MEELKNEIANLKKGRTLKQLKAEDKKAYYKIKSLSDKISSLKAEKAGQFITKEHLKEYRNLIIWILKNKVDYQGFLDLKTAMEKILDHVKNNKVIYKTEKGIKNIVCTVAKKEGLINVEDNYKKHYGIECTDSAYTNGYLKAIQNHALSVMMG